MRASGAAARLASNIMLDMLSGILPQNPETTHALQTLRSLANRYQQSAAHQHSGAQATLGGDGTFRANGTGRADELAAYGHQEAGAVRMLVEVLQILAQLLQQMQVQVPPVGEPNGSAPGAADDNPPTH